MEVDVGLVSEYWQTYSLVLVGRSAPCVVLCDDNPGICGNMIHGMERVVRLVVKDFWVSSVSSAVLAGDSQNCVILRQRTSKALMRSHKMLARCVISAVYLRRYCRPG